MEHVDKFDSIRTFVLDYIALKRLNPGERIPSMRELANMTGSSLLTVHRALSAMVSEGILISKRGAGLYIAPSPMVRSRTVGIFFSCRIEGNAFVSRMFRQLHDAVSAVGYLPVFLYRDRNSPPNVGELGLGGAILYNSGDHLRDITSFLAKKNIPLVTVNDAPAEGRMPHVGTDNFYMGRMVAKYFAERGHRKFMILSHPGNGSSIRERIGGFQTELRERGLGEGYVFGGISYAEYDKISGRKRFIAKAAEFLAADREITGVFAIHDVLAFMLVQRLRTIGLRVPEDISIIGCDDQEFCETMEPALTTVAQPTEAIAEEIARIIADPAKKNSGRTVLFKPELIVRNSVVSLSGSNP